MLNEDAALAWLIATLENDATLKPLIHGVAPEAVWGTLNSPFVRIDRLEAHDLMVIGTARVWTDCVFHVRGVHHWRSGGRPDRTTVDQIGQRIDELLHGIEADDGQVHLHAFREESTPDPVVIDGGKLWLQSGGVYRLRAQPSPVLV
jgi:hypothetical protein